MADKTQVVCAVQSSLWMITVVSVALTAPLDSRFRSHNSQNRLRSSQDRKVRGSALVLTVPSSQDSFGMTGSRYDVDVTV